MGSSCCSGCRPDRPREIVVEEPLHSRVADELADVLVYVLRLADQSGVDLHSAALAEIQKSALKHPADGAKGVAPQR